MNIYFSPWKTLLLSSIQRWGGDTILYLNKKGLEVLTRKLNPFWNDVFCNFSELKSTDIDICESIHMVQHIYKDKWEYVLP